MVAQTTGAQTTLRAVPLRKNSSIQRVSSPCGLVNRCCPVQDFLSRFDGQATIAAAIASCSLSPIRDASEPSRDIIHRVNVFGYLAVNGRRFVTSGISEGDLLSLGLTQSNSSCRLRGNKSHETRGRRRCGSNGQQCSRIAYERRRA